MDPYLNIDAWTMSPYEHGEVFVTHDGGETDLDFGHYERFIDVNVNAQNSITTGKIYRNVLEKERNGDYQGKNVQVIPDVVHEVKENILTIAQNYDITMVEIGGTVGDIEWPHFFEALRQLRNELWEESVITVHVAPLLYLEFSGELKTKAIQHSVMKLREIGVKADFLVCRTWQQLGKATAEKLALFCDLDKDAIIEWRDLTSIYEVPVAFQKQHITQKVQARLWLPINEPNLTKRKQQLDNMLSPHRQVTIAIAGKYTSFDDCYLSVIESLKHAAIAQEAQLTIKRIDTEKLEQTEREKTLAQQINDETINGVIVPWGFGKRGVEWMINVAHYCRKNNIPYMGICLGLQVAVIDYARHEIWLTDAHSQEFSDTTPHPVIALMDSQKNITTLGWTMRLGEYTSHLQSWSLIHTLYNNQDTIVERHRHRFEVNADYHDQLQSWTLRFSGMSSDGRLVEHMELTDHPYFVATQAHPEFLSRFEQPHPMFMWLIKASLQ